MKVKISKNELFKIIDSAVKNIINEVRYIPSYVDYVDYHQYDFNSHDPINKNENIRVFHGTDMKTAMMFAKNGINGTQRANRRFSYETGMNPHGLFVTTSFNKATDFFGNGNSSEGYVVLEFTVNEADLDTPVWNGQGTYFGQGSNPIPFRNKEERDVQKQKYNDEANQDEKPFIRNSNNPALAKRIFDNNEHQALFFGQIGPNQIKRFWVKRKDNNYKWEKYNLSQFLHKFGNENKGIKQTKLFTPNEDFISIEDMMERAMKHLSPKLYNQRKENGTLPQEIQRYIKQFKEMFLNDDESLYYYIQEKLYPKQAIQLIGKERYDRIMGKVWR